ncbi:hypothetical protein ABVK25_010603 [Lepraria finkii]|uniref:Uncharacterized protein n=1 Tax=Lepraria finkii TaxID=1340010 RepID=A0ABR4AVJ8_9LECA
MEVPVLRTPLSRFSDGLQILASQIGDGLEEALEAICREIIFQWDYRNCMLKSHLLEQCKTAPRTKYTILGLKTTAERNIVRRAWHRRFEDADNEKVSGGTELSIWW